MDTEETLWIDDDETGRLWHVAREVLSADELQALIAGLSGPDDERRGGYWLSLSHIPAAIPDLLQQYVLTYERPTGWRWDDSPPSICLPELLLERFTLRVFEALK